MGDSKRERIERDLEVLRRMAKELRAEKQLGMALAIEDIIKRREQQLEKLAGS